MEQEDIIKLQERYQQSQALEEHMEFLNQQSMELQQFDVSLSEIEKSDDNGILAPIGKGIFVKADVKEKDFFVEVGAGVVIKKSLRDTKKVVSEQVSRIGEMKYQIREELEGLGREMQEWMKKIEEFKNQR